MHLGLAVGEDHLADDRLQKGGLAAAHHPNHHCQLAFLHLQRHLLQGEGHKHLLLQVLLQCDTFDTDSTRVLSPLVPLLGLDRRSSLVRRKPRHALRLRPHKAGPIERNHRPVRLLLPLSLGLVGRPRQALGLLEEGVDALHGDAERDSVSNRHGQEAQREHQRVEERQCRERLLRSELVSQRGVQAEGGEGDEQRHPDNGEGDGRLEEVLREQLAQLLAAVALHFSREEPLPRVELEHPHALQHFGQQLEALVHVLALRLAMRAHLAEGDAGCRYGQNHHGHSEEHGRPQIDVQQGEDGQDLNRRGEEGRQRHHLVAELLAVERHQVLDLADALLAARGVGELEHLLVDQRRGQRADGRAQHVRHLHAVLEKYGAQKGGNSKACRESVPFPLRVWFKAIDGVCDILSDGVFDDFPEDDWCGKLRRRLHDVQHHASEEPGFELFLERAPQRGRLRLQLLLPDSLERRQLVLHREI
mmetsp:Transcript_588/g.1051  ORF Transcript_588/g.1051 Transcript_588/m.1051 type:complete len:475 (+) Transcript_588:3817-5241(+)